MADELKEHDMLPSIRSLAADLKISVITTMRAYADLEKEGFISSMQGKGFFVKQKNLDYIREEKLKEVEYHLAKSIKAGKIINLSERELLEIVRLLYKEQ